MTMVNIDNIHYKRGKGMTFKERKALRKAHYEKYVKGWKQRECTACSGSGYYDNDGSPPCGACDGTGREFFKPVVKG